MVRNFTTALAAALVLGSVGVASARPAETAVFAPNVYDGVTYPHRTSGTAICPVRPATTITA